MVEDLHAAVETALAKIAERAEHSALPGLELFSALLNLPGKLVRVSEAQEVPEEFARGGIVAGLYRLLSTSLAILGGSEIFTTLRIVSRLKRM